MEVDRAKKAAKEWAEAHINRITEDARFHIDTLEIAFLAGYASGIADANRKESARPEERG